MTNRFLLVICTSLVLTACGGGGGGGGTPAPSNEDNSQSSDTGGNADQNSDDQEEAQSFTQRQNAYLPLIEGTGWSYSVGENASADLRVQKDGDIEGQYVVSSSATALANALTVDQVFVSTPEAVELVRLDFSGTEIFGGVSVESLSFGDGVALKLLPNVNLQNSLQELRLAVTLDLKEIQESLDLSLGLSGSYSLELILNAEVSVTNAVGSVSIDTWGILPSIEVRSELVVTDVRSLETIILASDDAPLGAQQILAFIKSSDSNLERLLESPIELTLSEIVNYVAGIGIVNRTVSSQGVFASELAFQLADLLDLPEPIIYQQDQNGQTDPVLLDGSSELINIAGVNLLDTEYTVLNADMFNAASKDWIAITNDTDSAFRVSMMLTQNTPSSTESLVIYLNKSNGVDQFPVNVTIQVQAPN